mmetsp:Transcript_19686/g.30404  ORF Transcript_19686/g.30404 Transcript_19686/m.30404 type:complete len:219 (+) Transcript_19686:101-757(+)
MADLDTGRMEAIKNELGDSSRVLCFKCDVTKEEEVKAAMYKTKEAFGTIHVALASAGVIGWTPIISKNSVLNTKHFEKMFAINVFGSVYMAKYAAMIMRDNKPVNEEGERGLILFISSIAGEESQRGSEAYGATKAAVNGMTLPMARTLGKYNIRVATVAPGIFHTPIAKDHPAEVIQMMMKQTPMGRPGKAKEFAHFVQAIVENPYINGGHLRIDGA